MTLLHIFFVLLLIIGKGVAIMILRKPYAFLIKHFRIIHLLLLAPMLYLITKTSNIVSFFRSYVANNYTTNLLSIASTYINLFMYLAVLIIIIAVIAIYYLMRQKKKSTKLYFFILLYYIFLFVLITLTYSILSNMEHNLITAQSARAYRDISVVLCLPQYFFFIYTLIRGIGFDIKKFDFANDLKDLEITDIDNEEFEFEINVEGYKAKRTFRRFLRETKYYILEHKFIFSCILVVFVITIGTLIYLHFGVYNQTYHESDKMTHNYFNIQITDSILTNLGLDGNVITNGKYYLILQLDIENRSTKSYALDYTNFRLVLNNKNIYPTLDRGDFFIDYGIAYKGEEIKPKVKNYYVLAYEIPEEELTNSYTIKILESIDYQLGEISTKYKNIQLSPMKIGEVKEEETLTMDKTVNFKNSTVGYTTLKINSYTIDSSYTYRYQYCYTTTNCKTLMNKITPDITGNIEKTTLLILNPEYNLDRSSIYASNIKLDNQFFEHFLSLRYTKNDITKVVPLINRTPSNLQDALVFETSKEIEEASMKELLITIRNKRYVIQLQ